MMIEVRVQQRRRAGDEERESPDAQGRPERSRQVRFAVGPS
jgi:hypothetical protein